MECSCSISSHMGDAEFDAVLSQEMVISKTTHTCGECGRKIRPGMRYERFVGCFDGTLETYKTCRDCLSLLRNAFFSDWMFNGLWESFRDHMHDRGDATTKSQAFDAMVEFYRTIGIEIKKKTIETKYYRASALPSNEGSGKNPTATSDSNEIKQIKQSAKDGTERGGPRPGAGRKMKAREHGQPARKEKIKVADYDLGSLPMRYVKHLVFNSVE